MSDFKRVYRQPNMLCCVPCSTYHRVVPVLDEEHNLQPHIINSTNNNTKQDKDNDSNIKLDRYGFFITDKSHCGTVLSSKEQDRRRKAELDRTRVWVKMIKSWSRYSATGKLKTHVNKGIPDCMRGYAWYEFLNIENEIKTKIPSCAYEIDTVNLDPLIISVIDRDIHRTYPFHILFAGEYSIGQASLRRLLQWYAVLDPEVGYCQGMGFIAGLFLMYMIEEQAFYAFYATLMVRYLLHAVNHSFYYYCLDTLETFCTIAIVISRWTTTDTKDALCS